MPRRNRSGHARRSSGVTRFLCTILLALLAIPAAAQDLPDRGIWPDLDGDPELRVPSWLTHHPATLETDGNLATLYLGGLPVKVYPLEGGALPAASRAELSAALGSVPELTRTDRAHRDADGDGIVDSVDVAIGARKTALNGARYQEGFERLAYPGGDVSTEIGVCTDVIVRAMRNAGHDLQALIYKDMKKRRSAYGIGKKKTPNRHIEHRRVRRQIVWFKKHLKALPTTFDKDAKGDDAWLPGDIVFMDTFPSKAGPDHVGIISDRAAKDGTPLVINNWTYGYSTGDMALLDSIPITHRFRVGLRRSR